MSKLKKVFERICFHLHDHQENKTLRSAIPIKDLRKLIQEYLLSEIEFENDLYALCYAEIRTARSGDYTKFVNRMQRMFSNSKIAAVRNWYRGYCFYNPGIQDCSNKYRMFLNTFYYLHGNVCNRLWCWYRPNEYGFPYNDCICGDPLTLESIEKNLLFLKISKGGRCLN